MAETRTGNRSEAEEGLLDAVSDDQLWRHAETLARWEKISGTPGEQEAARYLRDELEALGFDVAVHEFESLLGWPEEASLDVPGAGGVRAITHAFVPSTPESGLEADVTYVGSDHIRHVLEDVVGHVARVVEVPPGVDVDEFTLQERGAGLRDLIEEIGEFTISIEI